MTRASVTSRADLVFALYVELGPERSLSALHVRLSELSIRISLATLKRYSTSFDWVRRVEFIDARAQRARQGGNLARVLAMHERQAQIARALQGAGGTALQQLIADNARLREMKPADIARLLDLGMRAERDAASSTSDRKGLALAMANLMTEEVVDLFERLNDLADANSRAREFARGLDLIVGTHLSAEGMA